MLGLLSCVQLIDLPVTLRKRQESNPPDAVARLDGFEGRAPRRGRCSSEENISRAIHGRRVADDPSNVAVAACESATVEVFEHLDGEVTADCRGVSEIPRRKSTRVQFGKAFGSRDESPQLIGQQHPMVARASQKAELRQAVDE